MKKKKKKRLTGNPITCLQLVFDSSQNLTGLLGQFCVYMCEMDNT